MNGIQKEDIKSFANSFELSGDLSNSSFLITGATGLIGSTLVHCLLTLDKDIMVTCPVRNIEKAKAMFADEVSKPCFVECDLMDYLSSLSEVNRFDYIVHCASPTESKYMIKHPVETYELAIDTTRALLKHAYHTKVKSMVYISSLEYYGQNFDDSIITEDKLGYVDNTDSRSSYPLGKRSAEYLCFAYAKEFGVNAKVGRLTQTFGAGVAPDDNRVFAQFARSVIHGKDIVMHTTGESAKPYCYTIDCVSAILYILLRGANGEAYNVANADTYISIKGLAKFLREKFNPHINVRIELNDRMGYSPITKLNLSMEKLRKLGWSPKYNLEMCFKRLIDYLYETE